MEQWIQLQQVAPRVGDDLQWIDDRGGVETGRDQHLVDELHVVEVGRHRGDHEADADGEQSGQQHRERQHQQRPGEIGPQNEHQPEERDQRQQPVGELAAGCGQWEGAAGGVDLPRQVLAGHDLVRHLDGRAAEEIEQQVPGQDVNRVVVDGKPEESGEDDREDGHHQERLEQRPDDAQRRALVAQRQVAQAPQPQQLPETDQLEELLDEGVRPARRVVDWKRAFWRECRGLHVARDFAPRGCEGGGSLAASIRVQPPRAESRLGG